MLREAFSISMAPSLSGIYRETFTAYFSNMSSKISYFAEAEVSGLSNTFKKKTGKTFSISKCEQIIFSD